MRVQSRFGSMIEVCTKTASGFVINLAIWIWFVGPLFDIPTPIAQAFSVTCIFTVSALVRGYLHRRLFNHFTARNLERVSSYE